VVAGKAERACEKLWRRQQRFDVATLNPPRSGMPRDLAPRIAPLGIRRLGLVSCSPATLVNDLTALRAHGFQPLSITPYDMFPYTSHLETHVTLARVVQPQP
jgi:23S rRNA (uracil1939-C5)-methyltransferase